MTEEVKHPVESLLDTDAYKFSMGQCILHNFPSTWVKWEWKCRSKEKVGWLKPQVDAELDYICNLRFKTDELDFLSNIYWLTEDYIDYLERFYLKREHIHTDVDKDGQLVMWTYGPYRDNTYFETFCNEIVSELYMRTKKQELGGKWKEYEENARKKLLDMINTLQKCYDEGYKFTFADFGARRRFSREWHDEVVKTFVEKGKDFFIGTSDVLLAKKYNVKPIGTFAHELFQAAQGMKNVRISETQRFILDTWAKEYRGDLGIALSDIYGFRAFLRDFDKYFAKLFDGCRHDSGNPFTWGHMLIDHYKKLGIDPRTKVACWSDCLTAEKCVEIAKEFYGKIIVSFGVGTNITNNCGIPALSMVMKITESNGNPVAKLSDSIGKTMCNDPTFVQYLKETFHYKSIDEND